jgi:hypothetical protein
LLVRIIFTDYIIDVDIIFIFIYGLFSNTVDSTAYKPTACNGRINIERKTGKKVEGIHRGPFQRTVPVFVQRDCEKQ